MKIAIFSDSHDNEPNIEKAIAYVNSLGIDIMIHSGDISSADTLGLIAHNFHGVIYAVSGNATDPLDELQGVVDKLDCVTVFDGTGVVEIDGKKIAFNHYPDEANKLAQSGKYDLVIHGHDHKPWEKMIGKSKVLNPGTLAGLYQRPTFAIYDTQTDKAQLILIEKI